jgi:hypothetical protein
VRISCSLPILALCTFCLAGELLTPGEQVLKDLAVALGVGDSEAAVPLLGEVGSLYRYPASRAESASLLKMAISATRHENQAIAVAAVKALGASGASDAAAALKPFLRAREPLVLPSVLAAGRLGHEILIAPLADLAKSSGNVTVADQAYFALGAYQASSISVRRRVTEKVLSLCQTASRNRGRWRRLRAPALRALQRLIGRRLNSVQQFSDWWRHVKTRKDPFRSAR